MPDNRAIGDSDMLLVIDVQNDFCPGGQLAVPRGNEVVRVINRLAQGFAHVALTQDWHPREHCSFASAHSGKQPFETVLLPYGPQVLWPDHCVQGTQGAALHAGLDLPHAELVLRKGYHKDIDSYSAFFENDRRTRTGFAAYLRERGVERLFLAGLTFDFCVGYSAADARGEGFAVAVVEDACRGIDTAGSMAATRAMLEERGVLLLGADAIA